jgi:4-phospho-D-threonate 3-dehydrogenase / 4-phospho-D-erythronate 3-dehydrogenase
MSDTSLPRIGITLGDPAGIGPEVAARALMDAATRRLGRLVVFGFPMAQWVRLGGCVPSFVAHQHTPEEWDGRIEGVELITAADVPADLPIGVPSAAGGEASIRCILAAIDAAKRGRIDAIATAPISKEAVRMAGHPWPGHTELLAEKLGAPRVAMLFAGGPFRVVLVTIHMSLVEAIRRVTTDRIVEICHIGHEGLRRWFGVEAPRLGVCGLNPHAGEAGQFGHEERQVIEPALAQLRAEGIDAIGPLPPDTAFLQAARGRFDLVVAMYHDQGLIPIKTVAFEDSVNITLGLPTIRTSVDHGTAYDIAGRGQADPRSMMAAIRMASEMYTHGRA